MTLNEYDGRIVRLTDSGGKVFTGTASYSRAGFEARERGHDGECIRINGSTVYKSDIRSIETLPGMDIIRAVQTWQQAGAYYVRIQAMARKHHIPLRQEFDEHDTPETKYIVVTDDGFPIATARWYPIDEKSMMIGRVVVLPEYRRTGIGTMVVNACEEWAKELSFSKTVVESRDNKTAFYELMGYEIKGGLIEGDTFRCIRMEKEL